MNSDQRAREGGGAASRAHCRCAAGGGEAGTVAGRGKKRPIDFRRPPAVRASVPRLSSSSAHYLALRQRAPYPSLAFVLGFVRARSPRPFLRFPRNFNNNRFIVAYGFPNRAARAFGARNPYASAPYLIPVHIGQNAYAFFSPGTVSVRLRC